MSDNLIKLKDISKNIRQSILTMTTVAGSGHPTSSMSAVEAMVMLMHGKSEDNQAFFQCDYSDFSSLANDRLIFSKGHASPLFYGLYESLGQLSFDDILQYRDFNSPLEGHPTPRLSLTQATTGSLGQGLGIGLGMALAARMHNSNSKTWVLLGDSEMAEGSVWESLQLASYHNLSNLIGVIDVNGLGQRGQTMLGWDLDILGQRCKSMGWNVYIVEDGHDLSQLQVTYQRLFQDMQDSFRPDHSNKPSIIICKTVKGKGIDFLENKATWHGKALSQKELQQALLQLT